LLMFWTSGLGSCKRYMRPRLDMWELIGHEYKSILSS
jgi:hypothetical protein